MSNSPENENNEPSGRSSTTPPENLENSEETSLSERKYNDEHFRKFFDYLQTSRKQNKICDIVLKISGQELPAHRIVLASFSIFFETMFNGNFSESYNREVEFPEQDLEIVKLILNYMYTGEICFTEENAYSIFETANFFEITEIKQKCSKYLQEVMSVENVVDIWNLAEKCYCKELTKAVIEFCVENLESVSQQNGFTELCKSQIEELTIAASTVTGLTDQITAVILIWVNHDKNSRRDHLTDFIKYITPSSVTYNCIMSLKDEKVLRENSVSRNWLIEILYEKTCYHDTNFTILSRSGSKKTLTYNLSPVEIMEIPQNFDTEWFNAVAYRGTAYTVGGWREDAMENLSYRLDLNEVDWSSEPMDLKIERYECGACCYDNKLFFIGGLNENHVSIATCGYYDFKSSTIQMISPMHEQRIMPGVTVQYGSIYVCGGHNIDRLNTVERYDPREGKWFQLTPMKNVMGVCSCVAMEDSIYCSRVYGIGELEKYDIKQNCWEQITESDREDCYNSCLATTGKYIYHIDESGIWELNTEDNKWEVQSPFEFTHPLALFVDK